MPLGLLGVGAGLRHHPRRGGMRLGSLALPGESPQRRRCSGSGSALRVALPGIWHCFGGGGPEGLEEGLSELVSFGEMGLVTGGVGEILLQRAGPCSGLTQRRGPDDHFQRHYSAWAERRTTPALSVPATLPLAQGLALGDFLAARGRGENAGGWEVGPSSLSVGLWARDLVFPVSVPSSGNWANNSLAPETWPEERGSHFSE